MNPGGNNRFMRDRMKHTQNQWGFVVDLSMKMGKINTVYMERG